MEVGDISVPALVFFNVLVLITYPLHVLFVIVLYRRRHSREMGTPFHHLLLSIGISDLINSTGYLILQEPAWFGIGSEFYMENAWWMAKIVNICSIGVSNVPMVMHFFVAVNRLTAVRLPVRHLTMWKSPCVPRISLVVWIITILVCLPMICPVEFRGYEVLSAGRRSVAFQFSNALPSQLYTTYVMGLSLFIFPTILIYVYLMGYIGFLKFVSNSKSQIKTVVVRSTIAVFLTSLGDIILVMVIGSQQLYWMCFGEDLMPVDLYWLLFKIGHDLHNIATPWVMLIFFSGAGVFDAEIEFVLQTKRACLGESLARAELYLILGNLLHRFEILSDGDLPPDSDTNDEQDEAIHDENE